MKRKFLRGQLVSEEIQIGQSKVMIRAAENFFNKATYAIIIQSGKKAFIHSTSKDLQFIMSDFTKLVQDYRAMLRNSK